MSEATPEPKRAAAEVEAHAQEAKIAQQRSKLLASVAPPAAAGADAAAASNPAAFAQPSWLKFGGMYAKPPADATPELLAGINSTSNQVHSVLDLTFGGSAYTLGTLMVFAGQSNPVTFVSMWGAGTYLIALSQMRHVRGPTADIWTGEAWCAALWFLASFRQFREYRMLKWAGYASWSGLFLSTYYVGRALVANMNDSDLGHQNVRKFNANKL